jgi:hypothetical protein
LGLDGTVVDPTVANKLWWGGAEDDFVWQKVEFCCQELGIILQLFWIIHQLAEIWM